MDAGAWYLSVDMTLNGVVFAIDAGCVIFANQFEILTIRLDFMAISVDDGDCLVMYLKSNKKYCDTTAKISFDK